MIYHVNVVIVSHSHHLNRLEWKSPVSRQNRVNTVHRLTLSTKCNATPHTSSTSDKKNGIKLDGDIWWWWSIRSNCCFSVTLEITYREDRIGIPRVISNQQRANCDPLWPLTSLGLSVLGPDELNLFATRPRRLEVRRVWEESTTPAGRWRAGRRPVTVLRRNAVVYIVMLLVNSV